VGSRPAERLRDDLQGLHGVESLVADGALHLLSLDDIEGAAEPSDAEPRLAAMRPRPNRRWRTATRGCGSRSRSPDWAATRRPTTPTPAGRASSRARSPRDA